MDKGDKVIVTNSDHEEYGTVMEIIDPEGSIDYLEFVGKHIIAGYGDKRRVLSNGDYELYNDQVAYDNISVESDDKIKKFDVITVREKDNGTQRLFYQVIDTHRNGVSIIDDKGYKRSYTFDDVETVHLNNWFHYFNDLQEQLYNMKKGISELGEILINDIREGMNRID